jgi:hypothetical protein
VKVPDQGPEIDTLRRVVPFLASMTPGQLVDLTHWADGAWAKRYRPGVLHVTIPNSDVIDEFRNRVRQAESASENISA